MINGRSFVEKIDEVEVLWKNMDDVAEFIHEVIFLCLLPYNI